MKQIRHILSSFLANKEHAQLIKRLHTRKTLERLKNILPLDMQQNLLCISYRAPKLLFCFNHPSYAYNFNHYKTKDIMYCLKHYRTEFQEIFEQLGQAPLEIRAYVPKNLLSTTIKPPQKQEIYLKEYSNGTFVNRATDTEVHKKFEELRALIITLAKNQK